MVLKAAAESYMLCPLCDCDIPMTGEEKAGDEVYCPFCECPLKLRKNKEDKFILMEDF
jgi:hypothetical protein